MTIWELVMSRMKVLGAINILSAFPPLANAMVISLYASNIEEEAEIRGWPSEVYELMKSLKMRAGYEAVSEILSRLSEHPDFIEHLGLMIYHDLLGKHVQSIATFNYISSLGDVGFNLTPHTVCLDKGYVERLLDLSGGSISDLRVLDIAFIVEVRSRYGGEPLEGVEEGFDTYVCSPKWIPMVRDRVLKAIKADYSEESKLAERVLLDLLGSNRRLYSYLKLAYVHGVRVAWENRSLVQWLPGSLESLKPFISLTTPDSIPAINYALRDVVLKTMDSIEGKLLGEGGKERVNAIILEALPTHYIARPREALIVKPRRPEDLELAKLAAAKLGLEVATVEEGYISLKPGG
jgi:hypothetical protein